jgi:hypothetical protein
LDYKAVERDVDLPVQKAIKWMLNKDPKQRPTIKELI